MSHESHEHKCTKSSYSNGHCALLHFLMVSNWEMMSKLAKGMTKVIKRSCSLDLCSTETRCDRPAGSSAERRGRVAQGEDPLPSQTQQQRRDSAFPSEWVETGWWASVTADMSGRLVMKNVASGYLHCASSAALPGKCNMERTLRVDCGQPGVSRHKCLTLGCCYDVHDSVCFYRLNGEIGARPWQHVWK